MALACPTEDPNPCFILQMQYPAIDLYTDAPAHFIRNYSLITSTEASHGVTTGFYIYNYRSNGQQYQTYTASNTVITIYMSYTMGTLRFDFSKMNSECKISSYSYEQNSGSTDNRIAAMVPITFIISGTVQQLNCALGLVEFVRKGTSNNAEASSNEQMAELGAMSELTILIPPSPNYQTAFQVSTVLYFPEIKKMPMIARCPTFTYVPAVNRLDVPTYLGGACNTFPISSYGTAVSKTCARSPVDGRMINVCSSCANSKDTWLYVFEDDSSMMTLTDLLLADTSSYNGNVTWSLKLHLLNGLPTTGASAVIEANMVDGDQSTYCADKTSCEPGTSCCATTSAEAYKQVWVPPTSTWGTRYQIRIVRNTSHAILCRAGSLACPSKTLPDGVSICSSDPESSGLCVCDSGLCYMMNDFYFAQSRQTTGTGSTLSYRLWTEVVDTNTSKVVERGFLLLDLISPTCTTNTTCAYEASGTFYFYPVASGGELNFYKFSPLSIFSGSYQDSDGILQLSKVQTISADSGNIQLNLSTSLGKIKLADTTSEQSLSLTGVMTNLNKQIQKIVYEPPRWPNYNTQKKGSSPEKLIITVDKGTSNVDLYGFPLRDPLGIGDVTTFELDINILAVNDAPELSAPTSMTTNENTITDFSSLFSAIDIDAVEAFTTESGNNLTSSSCPAPASQVHHRMTLIVEATYGKVFMNVSGLDSIDELVVLDASVNFFQARLNVYPNLPIELADGILKDTGSVKCGLDNVPVCTTIDTRYLNSSRMFPDSLQPIFCGAKRIKVTGSISCLNQAVKSLRYRGDQDYNSQVPSSLVSSDFLGCKVDIPLSESHEEIVITINDGGWSGCTAAGTKEVTRAVRMEVVPVSQASMFHLHQQVTVLDGDTLQFTPYKCSDLANFTNPSLVCGAPQITTRENNALTILTRTFSLNVSVTYGSMTISNKDGLTFVVGTGLNDKSINVSGTLCSINKALQSLSYTAPAGFSTGRYLQQSDGTLLLVEEFMKFVFIDSDGVVISGQTQVNVKAESGQPVLRAFFPNQRRDIINTNLLQLSSLTADILFCGGDVPCTPCPAGVFACIELQDSHACDLKAMYKLSCDSNGMSNLNPRLLINSLHSNIWFFTSKQTDCPAATCPSRNILPDEISRMAAAIPGQALKSLDLKFPLPVLQGGVLRVWGSKTHVGLDSITIFMQGSSDQGQVSRSSQNIILRMNCTTCLRFPSPTCPAELDRKLNENEQGKTVVTAIAVLIPLALMIGFELWHARARRKKQQKQKAVADDSFLDNFQGEWRMHQEPTRPYPFWFNTKTTETTWNPPASPAPPPSSLPPPSSSTHLSPRKEAFERDEEEVGELVEEAMREEDRPSNSELTKKLMQSMPWKQGLRADT